MSYKTTKVIFISCLAVIVISLIGYYITAYQPEEVVLDNGKSATMYFLGIKAIVFEIVAYIAIIGAGITRWRLKKLKDKEKKSVDRDN